MRITREIQSYVRKMVEKKFANDRKVLNDKRQAEIEMYEEVRKKATLAAEKVFREELSDDISDYNVVIELRKKNGYGYYSPKSQVDDQIGALCQRIDDKIDDIIVNISLGGTKEDLDRLIQEAELD